MGEVSRDDLQGAIFADDFDYNEFVALITKHIEIQIPDNFSVLVKTEQADGSKQPFTDADNVVRQQLLDHVYDAIIELNKKEEPEEKTTEEIIGDGTNIGTVSPDPVPTSIGNPGGTKETVLDLRPEPEIKIDLNLGTDNASEPSSAEDVAVSEKEETVEVEIPMQGEKEASRLESSPNDSEVSASDPPASASPSSTPAYADRKSHIIALVKESKWTLKQITQIIDDQWGYAAKGKSSKTRVSKTIRDLRDNNILYEESNGVLTWRGEG